MGTLAINKLVLTILLCFSSLVLSSCFSASSTDQSVAEFKKISVSFEPLVLVEGQSKLVYIELEPRSVESAVLRWTITGEAANTRFQFTEGTVSIAEGSTSVPVQLISVEDSVYNPDLIYSISLEQVTDTRQQLDLKTQEFTLTDNEPKPTVSFSSSSNSVVEDAGTAQVYVSLDRLAGKETVLSYSVNGSSTADGTDFSTAMSVSIPKNTSSYFFELSIVDDTEVEGTEIINFDLDSFRYDSIDLFVSGTDASHALTIYDNESVDIDDPTSITLSDATANSGYARSQTVDLAIDEDVVTEYWCISELQSTKPANGTYPGTPQGTCVGGTGSLNGWHVKDTDGEPTDFTLGGGDGTKTVYVWTANVFFVVNSNPVSTQIVLDETPPSLSIAQAGGQTDPATSLPINFEVSFSEEIVDTTLEDLDFEAAGAAFNPKWTHSTSDNITYVLTVNELNGNGELNFSLPANRVTDLAGNPNLVSTNGADPTVTANLPEGTPIFRSVGEGNTSVLASGADGGGNDLNIRNGMAVFEKALPLNIGKGDVVKYDSNNDGTLDQVGIVKDRQSSFTLEVVNVSGGAAAEINYSNFEEDWQIFRAYSSMADALVGNENSSIGVDFDTWSGGKDLVAANENFSFYIYNDAPISSPVSITGWNTSGFNKLTILAAGLDFTDSGILNNHQGMWDNSKVKIDVATGAALSTDINYLSLFGLQIRSADSSAISFNPISSGGARFSFKNNILESGSTSSTAVITAADGNINTSDKIEIFNSLIIGESIVEIFDGDLDILSNTLVASGEAFQLVSEVNSLMINNLVVSPSIGETGTLDASTDYNSFTATGSMIGSNNLFSVSPIFIDASSGDYRLDKTDISATNNALDLSGLSGELLFDIAKVPRLGLDRGALASNLISGTLTGGQGDDSSSLDANWYGNSVPGSTTDVVLNYHCASCNLDIDSNFEVRKLIALSGYSGTISQGAGVSFQTNGDFTLLGGSFIGSDGSLDFLESFSVRDATISLSSTNTYIARNFHTYPGTSLSHNSGSLTVGTGGCQWYSTRAESLVLNNLTYGLGGCVGRGAPFYGRASVVDLTTLDRAGVDYGRINVTGNYTAGDEGLKAGGSIIFSGAGDQVVSAVGSAASIPGLVIDKPSGTLNLNTDILLRSSSFINYHYKQGLVDFMGNELIVTSGCCFLQEYIFSSFKIPRVRISGVNSRLFFIDTLTITETLYVDDNAGTGSLPGSGINLEGDLHIVNSGINWSSGLAMTGSNDSSIYYSAGANYPSIEINKDPAVKVSLGADFNDGSLVRYLNILSGNLDMAGFALTVGGDLRIESGSILDTTCAALSYGSLSGESADTAVDGLDPLQRINGGDTTPTFSVADVSAVESENLTFAIQASNYSCGGDITLDYQVTELTAHKSDNDIAVSQSYSGELTLVSGENRVEFSVSVTDDAVWEPTEQVQLDLSNVSSGSFSDASALGNIQDNDSGLATHIWTGGGADDLWSNTDNWAGGVVPTASDVAYFEGSSCTNCNVDIDQAVDVTGFRMFSNYTGTITQLSGNSVTVGSANFYQSGGSFLGSDADVVFNESATIDGGSFTASSAITYWHDYFYIYAGTQDFSVGTVQSKGDGHHARIRPNGVHFNDFNSVRNSFDVIFIDQLYVDGDLYLNNTALNSNIGAYGSGGQIYLAGDLYANSHSRSTGTTLLQQLHIVGTSPQTLNFNSAAVLKDIIFNSSSDINLIGNMKLKGRLEYQAGTVNVGTAHLYFTDIDTGYWNTPGVAWQNVTYEKSSGSLTLQSDNEVNGTFRYNSLRTLNASAGQRVLVKGNLQVDQANGGTGTIEFAGSGAQSYTRNDGALPKVVFSHSGTLTMTGLFKIRSGGAVYNSGAFASPPSIQFDNFEAMEVDLNGLTVSRLSAWVASSSNALNFLSDVTVDGNIDVNGGSAPTGLDFIGPGKIYALGNINLGRRIFGSAEIIVSGTSPQSITGLNTSRAVLPSLTINSTSDVSFGNLPGGNKAYGVESNFTYIAGNLDMSEVDFSADYGGNSLLDFNGLHLRKLILSKDGGADVSLLSDVHTDRFDTDNGNSSMSVSGFSIYVYERLVIREAGGGNTQIRLVGTEDVLITKEGSGNMPGSSLIVDKPSGDVILGSNFSLNTAGEDLNIQQGTVRMNGFNLSIADTLNIEAGHKIYDDCGTLTYANLTGTGTIETEVVNPDLSILDLSLEEGESGSVDLVLDRAICAGSHEVTYSFDDNTARYGDQDFNYPNFSQTGVIRFDAGERFKSITVATNEDLVPEADEDFYISLSGATAANLTDSQSIVTVTNDDVSTFVWVGGGADQNWSTAANWQGGVVPGVSDVAFFDGTCVGANCDLNLDVDINVAGLRVFAPFAGTITQDPGVLITVGTSHFKMASGSFVGSDAKIDVNGYFELSGTSSFTSTTGVFEVGWSDGTQARRNFGFTILDTASFVHNSGRVSFRPSGSDANNYSFVMKIFVENPVSLHDVEFWADQYSGDLSKGIIVTDDSSATITVLGDAYLVQGAVRGGSYELHGNLYLGYTSADIGAEGGNTEFIMVGNTTQEIHSTLGAIGPSVTVNTAGTVQPAAGVSELQLENLKVVSGTFEMPSEFMKIGVLGPNSTGRCGYSSNEPSCDLEAGLHYEGGVINHNNSTLVLNGRGYWGSIGGNLPSPVSEINLASNLDIYNLEISLVDTSERDKAAALVSGAGTLTVKNDITINDGSINDGTIVFEGDLYLNCSSGNRDEVCAHYGTTVLEWVGTTPKTYSVQSIAQGPRLRINSSSVLEPAVATSDLALSGFELASGSFTAPPGNFEIGMPCGDAGYQDYGFYNCARTDGFKLVAGTSYIENGAHLKVIASTLNGTQGFVFDIPSDLTLTNLTIDLDRTSPTSPETGHVLIQGGGEIDVLNSLSLVDGKIDGSLIDVRGNLEVLCEDGLGGSDCFYGGTTQLRLSGTTAQTISQAAGSVIPGNSLMVSKLLGSVEQSADINLTATGQNLIFVGDVIWNAQGFNLNIDQNLEMTATSQINMATGTLMYNSWNGLGTITP